MSESGEIIDQALNDPRLANMQMYLEGVSLAMCERAVKNLMNNACNNLIRMIYMKDEIVSVFYDEFTDLRTKIRKYFIGKVPDPDIFINFFDVQDTVSNVKIFYNQEDLDRFNNIAQDAAQKAERIETEDTDELTKLNNIKENVDISHLSLYTNNVRYDYNIYEIEEESMQNEFVKTQIETHINNILPMIIFTFNHIIKDIKIKRKELYTLLHPFIKPGLSEGKTVQLLNEQNILDLIPEFVPFNRVGLCLINDISRC